MRHTSEAAFERLRVSGVLKTRRGQAYATLYERGPLTGMELERFSGVPGMWKRLSELKALGLAAEVGERACSVTGQPAILWDVTDHLLEDSDYERLKPLIFFVVKKEGYRGIAYAHERQARKEWTPEKGRLYKVRVMEELPMSCAKLET